MKNKQTLLTLVVGAIVLLGLFSISVYNSLIRSSQEVTASWAQVENQLQRRFDLIPNLVESTKGIFNQEQEVFNSIAEARTRYSGANTQAEQVAAAGELESALGRLLVIVENYPQLASSETVLSLMDELAGTENRISVERKRYNETVKGYNTKLKTFPTVIMAGMMGFSEQPYFEAVAEAQTAPKVDLKLN